MYDLEIDSGKCVIHAKPLVKDHRLCQKAVKSARSFAAEYRMGLVDQYNFEVAVVVRSSKVVFVGHPSRMPKGLSKVSPFQALETK